ncbi:MAG: aspartyl protease family protein [Armatimonadetes bacterium]|nr:aspartyl protease family protein [Armatimonadota bacterium]
MGTFFHTIEIAAAESGPFVALEAVVDTGAAYAWIPRSVLQALGVVPRGKRQFLLADGRVIEREMAIVMMRLDGEILPTLCVIGNDDSQPLLGAFTLEGFALSADPVNRRLVPVPYMFMLQLASGRSSYPSAQRHPVDAN